ncbi:hypothetical protein Epro_0754 [Endomicrobium proavitum]|uniref:Uncharacterized protein n=1 Tax=Endomicrobium proavitum TaxID=1408281 RepID=A0A0G3WIJ9_9BACT|nr:hypothetical protein Epro_0754 [Endomicrobium proavitum]
MRRCAQAHVLSTLRRRAPRLNSKYYAPDNYEFNDICILFVILNLIQDPRLLKINMLKA